MTETNESSGSTSTLFRLPFRKKRPVSGSSKASEKNKNDNKKVTSSTMESNTETMLEPFQELVDDINWDTIDDKAFPMDHVNTDRPIASQAVAFVIRASRRGVVPLCAEVATILKENSRLKETVDEQREELELLRKENEILQEQVQGPRPVTVDFGLQTIQESNCQTMTVDESSTQTDMLQISCIRNEDIRLMKLDCSVEMFRLQSNEDMFEQPTRMRFGGVTSDCGSDVILTCSCSPLASTSTQNPVTLSVGVNTIREDCMDSMLGYFEHTSLEKSHRELEERHRNLISKCEDINKVKSEIGIDLRTAKEEIVTLQRTIQDLQNKEYEKEREEEMLRRHENYSLDVQDTQTSSDELDFAIRPADKNALVPQKRNKLLPVIETRKSRIRSSIFPGPILGCKCHMCHVFFRSSGILGFACSPYVTDLAGKNPVLRDLKKLVWLQNSKLQVQPNDKVIARNNRVGDVRYVGHLDGVGNKNLVYVGLELENQDGRHDGYLNGKRYFVCRHKHGLFIPLEDVLCVVDRRIALPTSGLRPATSRSATKEANSVAVSKRPASTRKSGKGYSSASFASSTSSTASSSSSASRASSAVFTAVNKKDVDGSYP